MQEQSSTILVVDDVLENVEVLINILKRQGYAVSVAEDGKTALQKVKAEKPNLILLDIMMPGGMDGFELCRHIKADDDTGDIPVIFVTALSETETIVRGFEVGGVDFITKPFRAREVMARVRTHLTLQQQKDEIRRLREQDRRYYEKLSQIKDDVMHMTSHDLKNPLNNVKSAVALLRRYGRVDDDTGAYYLDVIEESTRQMHGLIDGILDLAKLETGQSLQHEAIHLRPLLESILSVFDFQAHEQDIELRYQPPPDDLTIYADAERLEQAIQNLLSNALKYTDPGGSVSLAAETGGNHVLLSVQDSGIGVPKEDIPHLFDKFYRVNADGGKSDAEGTGLGLAIVKSIVEQHGGQVWVESEVGQGTRFNIQLPL